MHVSADAVRARLAGALGAFGRFWWDFLVGDTPELFVGGLVVLGVVAVLADEVSTRAAWVAVPLLVISALVVSVLRGRRG